MTPQFISVDGIQIAYYSKNEEKGNTLFFIHGNSSSHRTWVAQFESTFLADYRLIVFDLPAHGLSDDARVITGDYSLSGIGNIMAKAVKQLSDEKPYILTGLSLGTNIICEMLPYQVQPEGIVLASPCIISKIEDLQNVFLPNPNANIYFEDVVDVGRVKMLVRDSFFSDNVDTQEVCIDDFVSTRSPFRSLLLKSSLEGKFVNEIAFLQKTFIPLLFIFGKEEKNVNIDHLDCVVLNLWREKIVKMADAGHFVHADQPAKFNCLLSAYAADRFTAVHS